MSCGSMSSRGCGPLEEAATRRLLQLVDWVELDEALAESAGELGRRHLRTHPGIEVADFVIAALARQLDPELKVQDLKQSRCSRGSGRPTELWVPPPDHRRRADQLRQLRDRALDRG